MGSTQDAWRSRLERARDSVIVGCAPAVDEGLKTDALPGAVVVVARHPAHARVVSAEFGERYRAGNGIRHVILATVWIRDGVPANCAWSRILVAPLIFAPPIATGVVPIATIPLSQSTLLALAGPAQAASTVAFGLVVGRYAVAVCNHLHNLLYWNEHQEWG